MQNCVEHLNCSGHNTTLYSQDKDLRFELCHDCNIIWRTIDSKQFSKLYEQEYFDSKKYDNNRKHKVKKSGWLIDIASLNHLKINRILEVGCSIGYTLEAARDRKIKHLGIDISEYAVKFCNDKGLNASNATFDELIKSAETFDLIYMQHVLEHFENPFKVLNDCNKLLNKKGLVLILVPNSKYGRAEKKKEKHRFYSRKGVGYEHYAYFNYSTISSILKATGFRVVQQNYPVFTGKHFSFDFFVNRLFRRSISLINSDQEILVIAQKQ